uniref:Transglutaminase-like domain-containing protein n=1 Tax=Arcella intermedia TaxID=1963864 RepID=A0A6B2KYY9_9EUKA
MNEKQHHTSDYKVRNNISPNDPARMLVRRGQPFIIEIPSQTSYSFTLISFDPISLQKEVNTISIPLVTSPNSNSWGAVRESTTSGYKYTIYSPVNSQIGIFYWQLVDPSGTKTLLTNQLVVLFNPWNSADEVYYPAQSELSEYILNTQSIVWVGATGSASPLYWTYDQFHYSVLEVSLYFITKLSWAKRGNAALVSRHLSSWINVNDNGGLVWGRWQDPYTGGKNPTYWTGSLEIFQQYRKSQTGVKYGQCWVFGACLTTAARTLGIPSRTITNFDSAHEDQQSGPVRYLGKIDVFFDQNGAYIGMEGGSIWNFHVWCEFYFARSDVSSANGWQAVDGTPQELSDGFFQMGPASLANVKSRATTQQYDVDFVTSEVSALVYQWVQYNTGNQQNPDRPGFYLLYINKDGTGHQMSTKAVGANSVQYVTSLYKNTGFSAENGLPTTFALGKPIHQDENITFVIESPSYIQVGDNITLSVVSDCNVCDANGDYMLQIAVDIRMISYTGDPIAILERNIINLTLNGQETILPVVVPVGEYQEYLGMNRLIEFNMFAKLFHLGSFTGTFANKQGRVGFSNPPLVLFPLQPSNATMVYFDVLWHNPLDLTLHNGILRISGAYVAEQDLWVGVINPKGSVLINKIGIEIDSAPPGADITIFAKLLTDELSPVTGSIDMGPSPTL